MLLLLELRVANANAWMGKRQSLSRIKPSFYETSSLKTKIMLFKQAAKLGILFHWTEWVRIFIRRNERAAQCAIYALKQMNTLFLVQMRIPCNFKMSITDVDRNNVYILLVPVGIAH